MKLTNVKTYVIKTDPPNAGGFFWFFLKLETDQGIEGWGETAVLFTLLGLEDSYPSPPWEISLNEYDHAVIILLTALVLGLAPAITLAGFEQLVLNGNSRVHLGDWFHQLHHQYFTVNYGNVLTPLDKVFGSWHNGTSGTLKSKQ